MLDPQVRAPLSGAGPPSPPRHNPGVGGAGKDFSAAKFGGGDETAAAAHAAQAAEESAPAAAQAEKGGRERRGQFPGNVPYIDKKENTIFLTYKEIQSGAVAKSYMTNGLLIYGEIFAHILIC